MVSKAETRLVDITFVMALLAAVVLTVAIAPRNAWATQEGDQTSLSAEEIAENIASGIIGTSNYSEESSSDDVSTLSANSNVSGSSSSSVYYGDRMYETAIAEAKAAKAQGAKCDTALLVGPGDAWVDALSAAGLSASEGPILFTTQESLYPATKQALYDLGITNVILIGGVDAIGTQVEADLENAGITVVDRLWGTNCYETQMAIYRYGVEHDCWSGDEVIIATGTHYGDALSSSPLAYASKAPIFLTDGNASLNSDQKAALEEAAEAGNFKTVLVSGGYLVVSDETYAYVSNLSKTAGGTGAVRLSGENQYETSTEIANWAVNNAGFTWNNAAFTTGNAPYDALAGAVLQGQNKSVMLLVGDTGSATISLVENHRGSISHFRIFGGKAAVEPAVRYRICQAIGVPFASLPDFKLYLDAGHGWNDTNTGVYDGGATGSGYEEHDLCVELAYKVADILRGTYGIDVFVNDDGGWYKLRHAEAVELGCDALVSIHFNAAGGSGSMSFIHEYNASPMSYAWQSQIHSHLITGVGLADLGKNTAELAIVGGKLPAVLLEICFIDRWSDMAQYQSRKDFVAQQLAQGIVE